MRDWATAPIGLGSGATRRLSAQERVTRMGPVGSRTLAIPQVATRILSVADPVRSRAADWHPLVALPAGAVTTGVQADDAYRSVVGLYDRPRLLVAVAPDGALIAAL